MDTCLKFLFKQGNKIVINAVNANKFIAFTLLNATCKAVRVLTCDIGKNSALILSDLFAQVQQQHCGNRRQGKTAFTHNFIVVSRIKQ